MFILLLLPFVQLFLGCAPKNSHRVEKISFDGNGMRFFGFDRDSTLQYAMVQKKTPFLWRINLRKEANIEELNLDELRVDGWRIEKWYAHEGYLNAQFKGWEINTKERWGREKSVITGKIDIGKPTLIRNINIEGEFRNNIKRDLEKSMYISEGDIFRLVDIDYVESILLQVLQNKTYARSEVKTNIDIWPTDCMSIYSNRFECFEAEIQYRCPDDCSLPKVLKYSNDEEWNNWVREYRKKYPLQKKGLQVADVHFDIFVGPSCQFGEIQIEGPVSIPLAPVYDALKINPGDAYQISDLYQAQQRIYQLQTFSVVSLEPSLDESYSFIPVTLKLRENQFKQLRLGGGMNFENGARQANISMDYSHMNLGNRLIRMNWVNNFGYSIRSFNQSIFEEGFELSVDKLLEQSGPVIESELELLLPKYDTLPFSISTAFSYQQGVEAAYKFIQPALEIAISDIFVLNKGRFSIFQPKIGYHIDYFEYRDAQVPISYLTTDGSNSPSFLLSYLFQEFTLEGRDDPITTTKGTYAMLRLQEAGLGGQYNFVGANFDYRRFVSLIDIMTYKRSRNGTSIRQRLKSLDILDPNSDFYNLIINPKSNFAWRLNGGIKTPYSFDWQKDSIPLAQYFMIGGSDTVRGWRTGYLGSYICETNINCVDENGRQISREIIPLGGTVYSFGSFEWRRYSGEYGFVAFTDIGMSWLEPSQISLQELQQSVGVGVRYRSPIGIFRVDVARRLAGSPTFAKESKYAFHLSLVEAF